LVSIVGYTNVGKSTLFNLLTNSTVTAENKLFATLDPSQRRLFIPSSSEEGNGGRLVIVSDTVGFIRKLPKELETAFRATLEELYEASLLIHVVDASDADATVKYQAVRSILEQMSLSATPELVVLNKIDAVAEEKITPLRNELGGVAVSAKTKQGIANLLARLDTLIPRLNSYGALESDELPVE